MTPKPVPGGAATTSGIEPRIAVAYLARGAGDNWQASFERFLDSYVEHRAGVEHTLYVLFKGFERSDDLQGAKALFDRVPHRSLFLEDFSLDIGAYVEWAQQIDEDIVCAFNTASQILASDWLKKLAVNLALPNVGLVGATASYESLNDWNPAFPPFPNPHLRSNAFMLRRETFCRITDGVQIRDKLDAFNFESGARSLSRQIVERGEQVLLVGRNARGYSQAFWPSSNTFRLGFQANLLVGDNQTRNFTGLSWNEKREFVLRTWGHYIRDFEMLA